MFYIKNINITNFRTYSSEKFAFSPKLNIIAGENAVGKTSLVESIYYICFAKSFRTRNDIELINKNAIYSYLDANIVEKDDYEYSVTMYFDKDVKKIKKNNKLYKSVSEYIGSFKIVVFTPDELLIVKGTPLDKRRFMDVNISQVNKKYLNDLIIFKKILKERNEYLKKDGLSVNDSYLEVITNELIDVNIRIMEKRDKFLKEILPFVKEIAKIISDANEDIEIIYSPNMKKDNIKENISEIIKNDIFYKNTTFGVQRDSFEITINGENINAFGSQGQIKTVCISLILGLYEYFKQIDDKIVVILDDVFSELDKNRQNLILEILKNVNQTFITTTSINNITDEVLKDAKIIEIQKEGANE